MVQQCGPAHELLSFFTGARSFRCGLQAPAPLPRPGSVSGDDHTRNLIGGLVGAGGGSGDIVHHARNGSSGAG